MLKRIFKGNRGAINLTEALVAMALTVIVAYAVFSALFTSSRTLQTQDVVVNNQASLRQAINNITPKLRKAYYPLAYANSSIGASDKLRFTTPATAPPVTTFNCWKYRVAGSNSEQLFEETKVVTPVDINTDPYGVSKCLGNSTWDSSRLLVSNLDNSTPIFTPVDSPCLSTPPIFSGTAINCTISTATCPSLPSPTPAIPACPTAGVEVALVVQPKLSVGNSRDVSSLNTVSAYQYVDLPSAR